MYHQHPIAYVLYFGCVPYERIIWPWDRRVSIKTTLSNACGLSFPQFHTVHLNNCHQPIACILNFWCAQVPNLVMHVHLSGFGEDIV
jgi:hypothetical protein